MSQHETLDKIVERIAELRLLRDSMDRHDWQFQTGRTLLALLTVVFQVDDLVSCEIMSKLVGEIWMTHEGTDEASEERFNQATHRMFEVARQDKGLRRFGLDQH